MIFGVGAIGTISTPPDLAPYLKQARCLPTVLIQEEVARLSHPTRRPLLVADAKVMGVWLAVTPDPDAGNDDGVLGTEVVEGKIKVPFSKIQDIRILKPERINSYMNKAVATEAMSGDADTGFNVRASMDKGAYKDGDSGAMTVWLSHPSYLYIFNIGSDGSISILFPNRVTKHNLVGPAPFMFPTQEQLHQGQKLRFAVDREQASERVTEYMEILATKRELRGLEDSPIREAINHPLSKPETGASEELGKLLLKSGLRRDEIATATVSYEIYRKPNQ